MLTHVYIYVWQILANIVYNLVCAYPHAEQGDVIDYAQEPMHGLVRRTKNIIQYYAYDYRHERKTDTAEKT